VERLPLQPWRTIWSMARLSSSGRKASALSMADPSGSDWKQRLPFNWNDGLIGIPALVTWSRSSRSISMFSTSWSEVPFARRVLSTSLTGRGGVTADVSDAPPRW